MTFSCIVNINEHLKMTDEKKFCFNRVYEGHIPLSNTGNYVIKTCSQKFHLQMQFITQLNNFARV